MGSGFIISLVSKYNNKTIFVFFSGDIDSCDGQQFTRLGLLSSAYKLYYNCNYGGIGIHPGDATQRSGVCSQLPSRTEYAAPGGQIAVDDREERAMGCATTM